MKPKRLSRTTVYESDWITLHRDVVELPTGTVLPEHHVLDYPREAAAAVVFDEAGSLLFVRAYRYPTDALSWEIPAGGIDDGEDPITAAAREVLEETGYETSDHRYLYRYYPSNGMSNQTVHLIACTAARRSGGIAPDEVESAAWFSTGHIEQMLASNEITDGLTLTGLLVSDALSSER